MVYAAIQTCRDYLENRSKVFLVDPFRFNASTPIWKDSRKIFSLHAESLKISGKKISANLSSQSLDKQKKNKKQQRHTLLYSSNSKYPQTNQNFYSTTNQPTKQPTNQEVIAKERIMLDICVSNNSTQSLNNDCNFDFMMNLRCHRHMLAKKWF
jgi:hypothetical protein